MFTSMFMHGGWLHLIGNMWFLWIFGDNIEAAMGSGRFLVFYLLCGLAAGLTQMALDPHSMLPMLGASGANAGVLGIYMITYPVARIRTMIPIVLVWPVVPIPAMLWIGVWIATQFHSQGQAALQGALGGEAYAAHIGGFIAGIMLGIPMRRRAPS
ncbi:MAG: rhomboid family intramembrane serine protease [bacterium]